AAENRRGRAEERHAGSAPPRWRGFGRWRGGIRRRGGRIWLGGLLVRRLFGGDVHVCFFPRRRSDALALDGWLIRERRGSLERMGRAVVANSRAATYAAFGQQRRDECGLLPPPFTGEGWGGGRRTRFIFLHAPSLTLPPLRGGGHTECAATILPSINHPGTHRSRTAAT